MGKRFVILEEEKDIIRKMYVKEETKEGERKFCHAGNTKTLEEIVGDDEDDVYVKGVKLRKNGIKGMVDRLELMKVLRSLENISDGGIHLANGIMNQLKSYKPYNYFDETKKECVSAIDKIIELYKENEHGEELVKDIEKVYAMNHIDPRAKEFLKHSLNIIRGK